MNSPVPTDRRTRVGAVHALLNSIGPTDTALQHTWPAADVAHLLDGSLYLDRRRGTADDEELSSRIERLIAYSAATGATGILFTGSFFGDAVKKGRETVDVPVLTSFDGVVDRALALDRPLHVISTAADSVGLLTAELTREAERRAVDPAITGTAVTAALDALLANDPTEHDRLIVDEVRRTNSDCVVVFAQFSMERALSASVAATSAPVIGPATEGIALLHRVLTSTTSRDHSG